MTTQHSQSYWAFISYSSRDRSGGLSEQFELIVIERDF